MRVFLYSELQRQIEKSGVVRAILHQRKALEANGVCCAERWQDADVVHINTVFPHSFFLAKKAKRHGIPVVYHAHSTKEDFRNSYVGSNLFAPLFQRWIKLCYQQGTKIVTPSFYARSLLKQYGIEKKIHVISNGIALSEYQKDTAAGQRFRKQYGYKPQDQVILSVGMQIRRKGILDFVQLAKAMPQYQFIWFGCTNLRFVSRKVRQAVLHPPKNLQFAGYVPKEQLQDAYSGCDLFLFPSYEETEGIVVLEALAMQIPVLLRRIPVYTEWLKESQDVYFAGDLQEFETKAAQILQGKLPDLTENGYHAVQKKDLPNVGKQLLRVYQSCME